MSDSTYESVTEAHGVSMLAEPIAASLNPFGQSFGSGSRHFSITLNRATGDGRPFQCFYAQGGAIGREPSAADVLECLVLDVWAYKGDFWDYADEYGVTPSREEEARWQLGVKQSQHFVSWAAAGAFLSDLTEVEDA